MFPLASSSREFVLYSPLFTLGPIFIPLICIYSFFHPFYGEQYNQTYFFPFTVTKVYFPVKLLFLGYLCYFVLARVEFIEFYYFSGWTRLAENDE